MRGNDTPVRPTDTMAVTVGDAVYPVSRLSVRDVLAFGDASTPEEVGRILAIALDAVPVEVIDALDQDQTRALVRFVLTGSYEKPTGEPAKDPAAAIYERVHLYSQAYSVDPASVLDRPWLDVLYFSDLIMDDRADMVEQMAVTVALGLRDPGYFSRRAQVEKLAADTRTPDEIFADVCAAQEGGWN